MTTGQAGQGQPQSFKVFLSHRYKSAETNLRFFSLFSDAGKEVQFKVDEGSLRISMTRLERMVRDADCFVGLYPYPEAPEVRPSVASLRQASAYFRLELDLAVRSGKPAIVFYDQRYRAVLPASPTPSPTTRRSWPGTADGQPRQAGGRVHRVLRWCRGGQDLPAAGSAGAAPPRGQGRAAAADRSAPGAYTREQLQAVKEVLDGEGWSA